MAGETTAGIADQITSLFPILTKFVMGLAGAPFGEICSTSGADGNTKHAPEQAAGGVLVLAALLILAASANGYELKDPRVAEQVSKTLLQFACLSTLICVLPFHHLFKLTKTECVAVAAIYWIPWFAVSQATFVAFPSAAVPLFFVPTFTASMGIWGRKQDANGSAKYALGVIGFFVISVANLMIFARS